MLGSRSYITYRAASTVYLRVYQNLRVIVSQKMKRKASNGGRRGAKRVKLAKKIKAQIKSQISKSLETHKRFTESNLALGNAFTAGAAFYNMAYGISRGTGEENFTGNKYMLKGISLKMYFESGVNKDQHLSYAIVQSDFEDFTQSLGPIPSLAAWFDGTTGPGTNWRIDPEKHKVLQQGKIELLRSGFSGKASRRKTAYIKFNRVYHVNPTTGFNRDGKNIYFVVWNTITDASTNESGTLYVNQRIYFKDC